MCPESTKQHMSCFKKRVKVEICLCGRGELESTELLPLMVSSVSVSPSISSEPSQMPLSRTLNVALWGTVFALFGRVGGNAS